VLVERDHELTAIDRALSRAGSGALAVLVFEGPPGVGKSSLLRHARTRAQQRAWQPHVARCSEFERELPFSIARQWFEDALADADEDDPLLAGAARNASVLAGTADPSPDDPYGTVSGLFGLCVNWCRVRPPLILLADDLHDCDPASLRFLTHLVRRGEDLGLALIATTRTGGEQPLELRALASSPEVYVHEVSTLSDHGTRELVAVLTDGGASAGFADACHRATGGIPFFIEQIVRAAREDSVELGDTGAHRVAELMPDGARRTIAFRLGTLGADAIRFARAVALLGDGADMGLATSTSGLGLDAAQAARDRLVSGGVLASGGLEFTHPLMRAAVTAEIGDGEAARAHRRIAQALDERSAPPERIAVHLQSSDPAGDPWVVETLCSAAERASAIGAFESAIALLTRALREPPTPDQRGRVLLELGRAKNERAPLVAEGTEHLQDSLRLLDGDRGRAHALSELAIALLLQGRLDESYLPLEAYASQLTDPCAQARVCALAIVARRIASSPRDSYADAEHLIAAAPPHAYGARLLKGALSRERLCRGASAREVADLARDCLLPLSPALPGDELPMRQSACMSALDSDDFDLATAGAQRELEDASRSGSPSGIGLAHVVLAAVAERQGRLQEAEALARVALDHLRWSPLSRLAPMAVLVRVLLAAGRADDARQALGEHDLLGAAPEAFYALPLVTSRVRLHLEVGDVEHADEDLLRAQALARDARVVDSAPFSTRIVEALVARAKGKVDAAAELAREQLALAESFGAPTRVFEALTLCAELADSDEQLELFERALALVAAEELQHRRAGALVGLGAALRRHGRRRDARRRLTEGVGLAEEIGDGALSARGRQELETAGARPRRDRFSGPSALTASELRVASLAAEGLSNREIAERLVITHKTVETHLSHVYLKLDITSRKELAAAIAGVQGGGVGVASAGAAS